MHNTEENELLCQIIKIFYCVGIWQHDNKPRLREIVTKFGYILFYPLFLMFLGVNAALCGNKNEAIYLVLFTIGATVVYVKLL